MITCAFAGCSNDGAGRCATCKNVYCLQHYQNRGGGDIAAYIICDNCNKTVAPFRGVAVLIAMVIGAVFGYYIGQFIGAVFDLQAGHTLGLSLITGIITAIMVAGGMVNK